MSGPRVAGLTGVTLQDAPTVCHECIWWQSREGRTTDKRKWIEKAETEWGPWGTVYYDADGHVLGSMQYGPAGLFPRAAELPAGPPSDDAVLVTCAYLVETSSPWVMQSLFLAAIGDARDRGAKALETFAYRYREGESQYERFLVHKSVGLPRRLRLPDAATLWPRRADTPRIRRAGASRGGEARDGHPCREGGLYACARASPAGALTRSGSAR